MKFEWQKLDGTEVAINSPDEILGVLNSLKARHDDAKNAGSKMEAAALEVQYDDQYKQWLWCMAFYYQNERKELNILIKKCRQASAWWDHWSAHNGYEGEVSELQRSLLEGLPRDLWPRSWAEAATILNRNPDFRLPSTDLDMAKQSLAEAIAIASSCLEMAGDLATRFSKQEKPASAELDIYHAKIVQLKEAMRCSGISSQAVLNLRGRDRE